MLSSSQHSAAGTSSCLSYPKLRLREHVQVDDLLAGCNVALTGPGAVDAVAIQHPGFALWPMADKESQESAGLETTAAVLIPDRMLPASESGSGSGSESGSDEGS